MIELHRAQTSFKARAVAPPEPIYTVVNGWTVKLACDTLTPQSCVAAVPDEITTALYLCPDSLQDYIYEKLGDWEIRIYPDGWNPSTEDYGGTTGAWATRTYCGVSWPDTDILVHEIGHGFDWALGTISQTAEWKAILDQIAGQPSTYRGYQEGWANAVQEVLSPYTPFGVPFCEQFPTICDFVRPIIYDPWSYAPPEPPTELTVGNLVIEPTTAFYYDTISISVDVTNLTSGALTEVVLMLIYLADTVVIANEKTAILNPEEQTPLTWNVKTHPNYGTFTVKIRDLTGTFITTRY